MWRERLESDSLWMMLSAISYELKIPLREVSLWTIKEIKNQYCCLVAYSDIKKENVEND